MDSEHLLLVPIWFHCTCVGLFQGKASRLLQTVHFVSYTPYIKSKDPVLPYIKQLKNIYLLIALTGIGPKRVAVTSWSAQLSQDYFDDGGISIISETIAVCCIPLYETFLPFSRMLYIYYAELTHKKKINLWSCIYLKYTLNNCHQIAELTRIPMQ